jgi:hypothetical protein
MRVGARGQRLDGIDRDVRDDERRARKLFVAGDEVRFDGDVVRARVRERGLDRGLLDVDAKT